MRDKTIITITTISGSKSYTIDQVFKKFIKYILLGIFALFVLSLFVIYFLFGEKKEYDSLKQDYHNLLIQNSDLEISIAEKKNELSDITEKISDIEVMIGVRPQENMARNERLDIAKISASERMLMFRNIPNGRPLDKIYVTSKYGWRTNPLKPGKREFHPGIDLRARMNTPVYATADGIVQKSRTSKAWRRKGYGTLLVIDHGMGFETLFGHLNSIKVKAGEFVKKGDIVAHTGNTGYSSGPHLHYEVRYINMTLEPKHFMDWNLQSYEEIFEKEKKVRWESLAKGIKWQWTLLEQRSSQKEQNLTEQ